jgi:hypothetical protein
MPAPFTIEDETSGKELWNIDVNGNVRQLGDLRVTGNQTVVGNQTFTGNQVVTGSESVGGTLGVTGLATFNAGTATAGSAPVLTPTLSSGTAAQLADLTRDYMVYMNITTSGTATHIEIGPTSTPTNTFLASASVTAGTVYGFRLPAGWYIKWTGTTTALSTLAVGC